MSGRPTAGEVWEALNENGMSQEAAADSYVSAHQPRCHVQTSEDTWHWVCTRVKDHVGPHVAHGERYPPATEVEEGYPAVRKGREGWLVILAVWTTGDFFSLMDSCVSKF